MTPAVLWRLPGIGHVLAARAVRRLHAKAPCDLRACCPTDGCPGTVLVRTKRGLHGITATCTACNLSMVCDLEDSPSKRRRAFLRTLIGHAEGGMNDGC